jgi:hypothetical protein
MIASQHVNRMKAIELRERPTEPFEAAMAQDKSEESHYLPPMNLCHRGEGKSLLAY